MTRFSSVSWMSAVVLAVTLSVAASVRADLSNGDFELGETPWDFSDDNAFIGDDPADPTPPVNQLAILVESSDYSAGDSLVKVFQEFSHAGGAAQLHFDFRILTEGEVIQETDQFQVWLNQSMTPLLDVASNDFLLADGNVHHQVLDVSLLGGSDVNRLDFRLVGDDDEILTTVEIDNVCIAPVPLPGAALLGIVGLGMAGRRLRGRARRRS